MLRESAWQGREDEVVMLLHRGVDPNGFNNKTAGTPLICAADRGHAGVVEILIDAGADVNKRQEGLPESYARSGTTPLARAAGSGHRVIVEMLLAAGADQGVGSAYDNAVAENKREILRLLWQHRAVDLSQHEVARWVPNEHWRPRPCLHNKSAWQFHEKVKRAGGWDAWVKKHREILASVVDKVVEAKFRRRAPQEVCAHVALFIAPPGGS